MNKNICFKLILILYIFCNFGLFYLLNSSKFSLLIGFIVVSFCLSLSLYPYFIKIMKQRNDVQQIKTTYGPAWHKTKSGTPTMGGLLFVLISLLIGTGCLLFYLFHGYAYFKYVNEIFSLLFLLLTFSAIGFFDDFEKISKGRNLGLRARDKFGLQVIAAVLYLFILPKNFWSNSSNVLLIIGYFLFCLIWIVGFSNAVNLTDGLDGLAAGNSLIVIATYLIMAIKKDNMAVIIVSSLLFGSIAGFLWFNFKPAQIFMGDLGSLAIGAVLAGISIQLNDARSLIILGIVFVLETLSVILQVSFHHLTQKKIFKMSPLHHHLELSGWSEEKINYTSYCLTLLMSLIYLIFVIHIF